MFQNAFLKGAALEPPPARSRLLSRSCCPPDSRVLQNSSHILDQNWTEHRKNIGHELRNRGRLREAVVVSAIVGGSGRRGSSCTNGAGVCGCAGSEAVSYTHLRAHETGRNL